VRAFCSGVEPGFRCRFCLCEEYVENGVIPIVFRSSPGYGLTGGRTIVYAVRSFPYSLSLSSIHVVLVREWNSTDFFLRN
jgi:hypothetical protein